jgi:hypothetical protein
MSDVNTALAWKLLLATGLASALTGNDLLALVFALIGALAAMSKQQPVGPMRRSIALLSVISLALAVTWFTAESVSHASEALNGARFELEKGRALVAWLVAYYAQDAILPAIPVLCKRFLDRWFGGATK